MLNINSCHYNVFLNVKYNLLLKLYLCIYNNNFLILCNYHNTPSNAFFTPVSHFVVHFRKLIFSKFSPNKIHHVSLN